MAAALAARGVSANQVTLAAVALSIGGGAAMGFFPHCAWPLLVLPLLLFIRMALNAIDGMLAREHAMRSNLGAVLNELGDVVSDAALFLPFALLPGVPAWAIVTIVVLAQICELAGVVGVQIGAERRYDGPMGKSDSAFFFAALALALGLGLQPGAWLTPLLLAVIALLCITTVNRARAALETAR